MKVKVDTQLCASAGQCVVSAPEVFDQDQDTGVVVLLEPHPAGELASKARHAARMCPVGAITIEDNMTDASSEPHGT